MAFGVWSERGSKKIALQIGCPLCLLRGVAEGLTASPEKNTGRSAGSIELPLSFAQPSPTSPGIEVAIVVREATARDLYLELMPDCKQIARWQKVDRTPRFRVALWQFAAHATAAN